MILFTHDVFLFRGKSYIQPLYRLTVKSYCGEHAHDTLYIISKYWDGITVGPVNHDRDGYKNLTGTVRLKLIQNSYFIDYPF